MSDALTLVRAEHLLSELGLKRAAEVLTNHVEAAATQGMTYVDFLLRLLEAEQQARYERYPG